MSHSKTGPDAHRWFVRITDIYQTTTTPGVSLTEAKRLARWWHGQGRRVRLEKSTRWDEPRDPRDRHQH